MKKIFLIIFLICTTLFISACSNKGDLGKFNTFAQCLSDKGIIMYGTEWCSHCKAQKEEFGSSFQYVKYVDCDKNKDICQEAGVKGYPTWIIDGELYPGKQSLDRLSSLSECELIEDQYVE